MIKPFVKIEETSLLWDIEIPQSKVGNSSKSVFETWVTAEIMLVELFEYYLGYFNSSYRSFTILPPNRHGTIAIGPNWIPAEDLVTGLSIVPYKTIVPYELQPEFLDIVSQTCEDYFIKTNIFDEFYLQEASLVNYEQMILKFQSFERVLVSRGMRTAIDEMANRFGVLDALSKKRKSSEPVFSIA